MSEEGQGTRQPVVSVAITAYNSARWIGRALESVFRQEVSFPIEVVVADDGSVDGTIDAVRAWREENGRPIRILQRARNVGMQRNYYAAFAVCRGRYVAWLDADDLWTDPAKLQLQVEALEADSTLAVCGHCVRFVTDGGEVLTARYPARAGGRYGLEAMIHSNFMPSVSILFRNGLHRRLPEWYFELSGVSDWPLLLTAGLDGDYLLLDRVMADYNQTPGSAYSARGFERQHALDMEVRGRMERQLGAGWRRAIRAGVGRQFAELSYGYRQAGEWTKAREAAREAWRRADWRDNVPEKVKAMLMAWAGPWMKRRGDAAPRGTGPDRPQP